MAQRFLIGRALGGPTGFRRSLEQLGPVFVKLGQHLALRPDVIPEEYADELMQLLDTAPPFPWSEARTILEQELGDPNRLFADINPQPIGSGSLAQVHLATTLAGDTVAIKILRPHIRELVLKDLRRASAFARLVEWSRAETVSSPRALVEELRASLLDEIDLRKEAANMRRLAGLAKDSATQRIPRVYLELSTSRVLTAEFLGGIPMTRFLALQHSVERRAWNIDADQLATNLLLATLQQIFRYQFFHADVHPGNLIVQPGQVIGYVDFGLCANIDETVRREQIRYLETVYAGDVEQMFKALLEVLIATPESNPEGLHRDLVAASARWQGFTPPLEPVAPEFERRSPVAQGLVGILRAVKANHFLVPANLLAMYRTLLTAETIAWRLGSSTNLLAVGREFFVALKVHDALGVLDPSNASATALGVFSLLKDAPGELNYILAELAQGTLAVNAKLAEHPSLARASNQRYRLLTIAIASVGVAFLLGEPRLPKIGSIPLEYILGALLAFLYLRAFLVWRRLR